MAIYKISEITDYMERVCPGNGNSNYSAIAKKYTNLNVLELLKGFSTEPDEQGLIRIRISTINENIKSRYNRTTEWLPKLKQAFPFYQVQQLGYRNHQVVMLSEVKPVFSQAECLEYFVAADLTQLLTELNPIRTDQQVCCTPVDTTNLYAYLQNTLVHFSQAKPGTGHQRTLGRNITQAKNILELAIANNGVLPQNCSQKLSGRTYMQGINLQNCASVVREAALGACWKYDLNTSVYAFMLDIIAKQFPDQDIRRFHMWEYLQDRDTVRHQLVSDCLRNTNTDTAHKLKLVKKVLTSLSFGAKLSTSGGAALEDIWNASDRQLFCNNSWISGLLSEIKLYQQVIRHTQFEQAKLDPTISAAIRTQSGRHSVNKLCALLYQRQETTVINAVIQSEIQPDQLLLQVHDAIYIKHTGVNSDQPDVYFLNKAAQRISEFAEFSAEQVSAVNYNAQTELNRKIVYSAQHTAHQQHIQQEEIKATLEYAV